MKLSFVLGLFLFASSIHAQGVQPIISEYKAPSARGTFLVSNGTIQPRFATVEALSFTVVDGKPVYQPLDPRIHVKLSTMSARLAPHETFAFDYQVSCEMSQCWLVFLTTLRAPHVDSGLTMNVQVPHVAYLCEKQKGCRLRILHDVFGIAEPK